jgi:hypothetical protein
MRVAVVLDCLQPDRLAPFWAAALGYRRAPSGGPYVVLVPDRQPGPERGLQRRLLRGPHRWARARCRPSGWPPSTPQWSTCSSGTSTWRGGPRWASAASPPAPPGSGAPRPRAAGRGRRAGRRSRRPGRGAAGAGGLPVSAPGARPHPRRDHRRCWRGSPGRSWDRRSRARAPACGSRPPGSPSAAPACRRPQRRRSAWPPPACRP